MIRYYLYLKDKNGNEFLLMDAFQTIPPTKRGAWAVSTFSVKPSKGYRTHLLGRIARQKRKRSESNKIAIIRKDE